MAVNYLTGDESPTAAKMNELWAEADSILDKSLDGKSTFLLHNQGVGGGITDIKSAPPTLFKGTTFAWTTGGTHTAGSTSVLFSAFATVPTHHSQSSYDTAADAATVSTYSPDGYAHLAGSSTPNLINSLKIHTRDSGGTDYHIWEYDQPAPEKEWKFGTCEILLALGSGASFIVPDTYLKYNCWKIHNLTDRTYTIYLDEYASPTDTFTIPPYSQRCVRRISPNIYDFSYKYFFKVQSGDPRFLAFDSFDGSIAQTMRANNITNPSFLNNIFEYAGHGDSPVSHEWNNSYETHWTRRITFDPSTHNNVSSEYATAGYIPSISDSTVVGDLVYHKGLMSYRKNAGSLTTGTIEFDGFSSLQSNVQAIGLDLADSAITHNYDTNITGLSISEFRIWPKTTNLLQVNDENAVRNMAAGNATIQTNFLKPFNVSTLVPTAIPRSALSLATIAKTTGGAWPSSGGVSRSYSGRTKTVGQLKTDLDSYSDSTVDNKSVILTTEGPYLLWRDKFNIKGSGNSEGFLGGLSTDYRLSLITDGSDYQVAINQEWLIALRLHSASYAGTDPNGQANYLFGYTSGWPTKWKGSAFNMVNYDHRHVVDAHKFHRMFEGPRKVRRYETATAAAGTTKFKHNDFNNDPLGAEGADFLLADVGVLTDTEVAFQTNDIDLKVSDDNFQGGEVNNPNYPRTVIDDVMQEAEDAKATVYTSPAYFNPLPTPSTYSRLNLLKENYNDFAAAIKKASKIRPLAIDEVYFGNQKLLPSTGYLFDFGGLGMAPMELYEGFEVNSDKHDLYTALGVTIRDKSDFPSSSSIVAAADNTATFSNGLWWNGKTELEVINDYRWVKIDDVSTRAEALGFEFRFEELAAPYRFGTYYYPNGSTPSSGWVDGFCTTNTSSQTATWKSRIRKAFLSGDWYSWGMGSEGQEAVGTNLMRNFAYQPVGTYNVDVNHGIVLHLYDTSRTNTAARAKVVVDPIHKHDQGTTWPPSFGSEISATASKSMTDVTTDRSYHYPDVHHHCAFFAQTVEPVTHSA